MRHGEPPEGLVELVAEGLRDVLWGRADYVVWTLRDDPTRYVQAARVWLRLDCEIVGPRHLTVPFTDDDNALIAALGWLDLDEQFSVHQQFWMPWNVDPAARAMAIVLWKVFGASGIRDLIIERGSDDDDCGGDLLLVGAS